MATNTEYKPPQKCISNMADMEKWKTGKTYQSLLKFLQALNEESKKKKLTDPSLKKSPIVQGIIDMLDTILKDWVAAIPPTKQPTRFGNKAFRTWFEKLEKDLEGEMKKWLPAQHQAASVELTPYVLHSVGNYQRIDYGSGHEASFVVFLYCINELGIIQKSDYAAIVLVVFNRYIELMRKVQATYMLEPAGSHGVWGLDDYQFLPFYFGAGQLVDHEFLKPNAINDPANVDQYADEYMYFAGIKFIQKMKKGPFNEHSPMLYDISKVPHQLWWKLNNGFLKMYQDEVLNKFPVIQHLFFGSLFKFE